MYSFYTKHTVFSVCSLLFFLIFFSHCKFPDTGNNYNNDDDGDFFFLEVSDSNLPLENLQGFSMDARFGDVDQDGDLDIVIANEFQPNILLINDGIGKFSDESEKRLPRVSRDSEDVGIADFDRDGDLDIVIVSEDDQVNEFYLNDGKGFFIDASERIPVTGTSNAVIVADINLDDSPDILIGNNGQNVILINDGNGFFADESGQRLPTLSDVTQDIELGDIDNDGDFDLLVGNEDNNRILLNNGQGVFVDESDQRIPLREEDEETREADFGDVDNDGDLDIFFSNVRLFNGQALPQNRLLINDGSGVFSDETPRLPLDNDLSMDADFVDVDQDGDLDIITANFDSISGNSANAPYRVYRNDGRANFLDESEKFFSTDVVGNGLDIEADDLNGDGITDLYLSSRGGIDRLLFGKLVRGQQPL